MGKLLISLLGVLVVGAPLVLFTWHTLSEALLGRVYPDRLALAAVALVGLLVLLSRFGRYLARLEEREG
jgi:hypothetical protein